MRRTLSRLFKIEEESQFSGLGVCPHKWNVIHVDEPQPGPPAICPQCHLPRNKIIITRLPRGLASKTGEDILELKWAE